LSDEQESKSNPVGSIIQPGLVGRRDGFWVPAEDPDAPVMVHLLAVRMTDGC